MNANDLESGMRVRVTKLEDTLGMFVVLRHLSCRKVGIVGTVATPGVVPGHGGDVWFVEHDGCSDVGAYNATELEPETPITKQKPMEPTKHAKRDKDGQEIPPDLADSLRRSILVGDHGTVEDQTKELIDEILQTFQDPDKWPMTDPDRIELLKHLYRRVQIIEKTKAATERGTTKLRRSRRR